MEEKLEKILEQAFDKLEYDKSYAKVSVSNRPELCDFQINTVFGIAKKEHKNPIEIGELITEKINSIDNFSDYFKEVSFAKPGFINITLSDKMITDSLNDTIRGDGGFGSTGEK